MKKIIFLSFFTLVSAVSVQLFGNEPEKKYSCWSAAFTAGYVFKHDSAFKEVYGHGIINTITADLCYYFFKHWGIGEKISYWRAKGHSTFLDVDALLQEVPITVYIRAKKDFNCGLQLYASLGGGIIWTKESTPIGCSLFSLIIPIGNVHVVKGIGEAEVGLGYQLWRCISFTSAFRYLFPGQSFGGESTDFGGFDLRAGLGFQF